MQPKPDKKNKLFLASQSPRRYELLKHLAIPFEVIAGPDIDEKAYEGELALPYVQRMLDSKCRAVLARLSLTPNAHLPAHLPEHLYEHQCILVADTTVTLDGAILGKPVDRNDANRMLKALSGRTHQVITGIAVSDGLRQVSILQTSHITFTTLDQATIDSYTATKEPFDKAGSYGIQGLASAFVSHLDGSYTGVMGLPLFETAQLLRQFNVQ
jgi:septum formation protein